MSALTEKIAAEHQYRPAYGGCSCGADYEDRAATYHGEWGLHGAHIATVTEAAVREQIAAELTALSDTTWDAYKNGTGIERADPLPDGQSDAYDTAATLAKGAP